MVTFSNLLEKKEIRTYNSAQYVTASTPSSLLAFLYKTYCAYPCIVTFSPGVIYLSKYTVRT